MGWPKAMPIVEVEWVDSCTYKGWQSEERADEYLDDGLHRCASSGYLYRKDKLRVTLMQNVGESGSVGESIDIPRSCVRSITVLKKATRRK